MFFPYFAGLCQSIFVGVLLIGLILDAEAECDLSNLVAAQCLSRRGLALGLTGLDPHS